MSKIFFFPIVFSALSCWSLVSFEILEKYDRHNKLSIFSDSVPELETNQNAIEIRKKSWLFRWRPNASYLNPTPPECHFKSLEDLVYSNYRNETEYGIHLQAWVQACESYLTKHRRDAVINLLRFSNVVYDVNHIPGELYNVRFKLSSGIYTRGVLALKNDGTARPTIIVKCGIYCDATDGGVIRSSFMHLFETSPFNVLFLGNLTGKQYLIENEVLAVGGFDGGSQVLEIASFINSERFPYHSLVGDIHVLGISLGANSALFSGLYQSQNPEFGNSIKSVAAICPVVRLKDSLESVFEPNLPGISYSVYTNKFFREALEKVPLLKEFFDINQDWWPSDVLKNSIEDIVLKYYQKRTKDGWPLKPFYLWNIKTAEDFWQLNDFTNYYEGVRIPTMLMYADDDFIVRPSGNSRILADRLKERPNPYISIIGFKQGTHCAFNIANSWATFNSLLRSFFLKHSRELEVPRNVQQINLPKFKSLIRIFKKLSKQNIVTNYKFRAKRNSSNIRVEIWTHHPEFRQSLCQRNPWDSFNACHKRSSVRLPMSYLSQFGVKVPKTKAQVKRLNRWLNTSVNLLNSSGKLILGGVQPPTQLEVFHDFYM